MQIAKASASHVNRVILEWLSAITDASIPKLLDAGFAIKPVTARL